MRVPDDIRLADWIRALLKADEIYKFYKTDEWIELRDAVLRDSHYECARCLERGRYTRAVMVHHVNEVRKRPDMALTREYKDKDSGMRANLMPLCFACHEAEHNRFGNYRKQKQTEQFSNVERW